MQPLEPPQRWMLRLAYHGAPFRGFAENEGVDTVAGTLRAALERITQHPIAISCAGRTDAGVHALDQAVTFDTTRDLDHEALRASLNGLCKPDIVVRLATRVASSVDARFSCTGRTYRYRVLNRRLADPFRRDLTWRVARRLDLAAMQAGVAPLVGTHDFSSFCRRQFDTTAHGEIEKPRVRDLRRVEWSAAGDEVQMEIEASSFCQQMVRSIVGLSVDIGLGSIDAASVPDILAARDRTRVPRVAPPQGLFLQRVAYGDAAEPG